jgi:hypothetical protein
VRLAPKNKYLGEAGLSFTHRGEVVETDVSPEVKEALRKGRLQFIGKSRRS